MYTWNESRKVREDIFVLRMETLVGYNSFLCIISILITFLPPILRSGMSSPVSRKSKVRNGHRTSAKRAIAASDEILEQLDPTKVTPQIITKLKHQKQTLQGKFDILKQLDEEILGLVDEDHIEEEIQSADCLTEAIQWAMERIEAALADQQHQRAWNRSLLTQRVTPAVHSPEGQTTCRESSVCFHKGVNVTLNTNDVR